MPTVQKVAVILAITGLATALTLKGRQTASVTGAFFKGLSQWSGKVEGL